MLRRVLSGSPTSIFLRACLASGMLWVSPYCLADALDELLQPAKGSGAWNLEDQKTTIAWKGVVNAFRKNDLKTASELGNQFLAGSYQPTPYQLLGVRVMVGLASGGSQTLSNDPVVVSEVAKVMEERVKLTAEFARHTDDVREADARINQLTQNRRQAVQQGTAAYRECVLCDGRINTAKAALAKLQGPIEANKARLAQLQLKDGQSLKADILQLLDMLTIAGEVEAGFAIANVYLRTTRNDLEVARKQQDFLRLQGVAEQASKIVAVVQDQQRELVVARRYWAAASVAEKALGRVRLQGRDADLLRMVSDGLAADMFGINMETAKAARQISAIKSLAQVDARKAFRAFHAFTASYPDHPDLETLKVEFLGERSGEMKAKLEELITAIEESNDSDPAGASALLDQISSMDVDPAEMATIGLKLSSARRSVLDKMINDLDRDLTVAMGSLGHDIQMLVVGVQTADSEQKKRLSLLLSGRVSSTLQLPVFKAALERAHITMFHLRKLNPSPVQSAKLAGMEAQVSVLKTAATPP